MSEMKQPEEIVAQVCDAILDKFVERAAGPMRRAADAVYEDLLHSVQDHLKDNASWNLSQDIARCRRVEIEGILLRDKNRDLMACLQEIADMPEADMGFNPLTMQRLARAALDKAGVAP